MLVSHASGSIGCEVWRAMVSIFCLSPYWDRKPGGGMGGVGPRPASRGPDLGGLLLGLFAGEYLPFWSFITRICGAQCYAGFSVSISTVSQVTFRLQVARSLCRIMKLPRFLPSGHVLESPRQLVHSLVFLLHITKRIFLDPVVCEGWAETGFSQLLVGAPCNGCVLQVPVS